MNLNICSECWLAIIAGIERISIFHTALFFHLLSISVYHVFLFRLEDCERKRSINLWFPIWNDMHLNIATVRRCNTQQYPLPNVWLWTLTSTKRFTLYILSFRSFQFLEVVFFVACLLIGNMMPIEFLLNVTWKIVIVSKIIMIEANFDPIQPYFCKYHLQIFMCVLLI